MSQKGQKLENLVSYFSRGYTSTLVIIQMISIDSLTVGLVFPPGSYSNREAFNIFIIWLVIGRR